MFKTFILANLQTWATKLRTQNVEILRFFCHSDFMWNCEINFGHFETPKSAILTIWAALNFELLETFDNFDIFKCEIFPNIKFQGI